MADHKSSIPRPGSVEERLSRLEQEHSKQQRVLSEFRGLLTDIQERQQRLEALVDKADVASLSKQCDEIRATLDQAVPGIHISDNSQAPDLLAFSPAKQLIDLNDHDDTLELEARSDTAPADRTSLPAPSEHLLDLPPTRPRSPIPDNNGAQIPQQQQQQLDPKPGRTTKRVRFDTYHENNRKRPAYGSSSPDPLLTGLVDNDAGAAVEPVINATPVKKHSSKKPGASQKRRRSSQIARRRTMAPLELFRRGGLDISEDEGSCAESASDASRNPPKPLIEPLDSSQVKDSAGAKPPKRSVSKKAREGMLLSQHEDSDQQTAAVKKQRAPKSARDDAKPKSRKSISRKSISAEAIDQSAPIDDSEENIVVAPRTSGRIRKSRDLGDVEVHGCPKKRAKR